MHRKDDVNASLFNACHTKSEFIDINEVKSLLEQGADPNSIHHCSLFSTADQNKDAIFPLLHIIAGKRNSAEIASLLVKHGAEIEKKDGYIGNTSLLTAIALRDVKLAKFYISQARVADKEKANAILNQKDSSIECQNTPLVLALKKGMTEVALELIDAGADVNIACRNGETALHWSCMLRNNEITRVLLAYGADANKEDKFERTPYEYYVYQLKLVDLANPNGKVCRANMHAFSDLYFHLAENHHDSFFQALTDLINERNKVPIDSSLSELLATGRKATFTLDQQHEEIRGEQYSMLANDAARLQEVLFLPTETRDLLAFIKLTVAEINAELTNARFKNAPLSLAALKRDNDLFESLLLSLDHEGVNAQSTDGFTALHWAAMSRNEKKIRQLMERGADPTIPNKYGRTAIDYYCYQIRAADFEGFASEKFYPTLCKNKKLAGGSKEMPEINDYFNNEVMKDFTASLRNTKPIDMSLFDQNEFKMTNIKKS